MAKLRDIVWAKFEELERVKAAETGYKVPVLDLYQLWALFGGPGKFRDLFYDEKMFGDSVNQDSLEGELLSFETRDRFSHDRVPTLFQFQSIQDLLSIRRISEVAGKSVMGLSTEQIEQLLVLYATDSESIHDTYHALSIDNEERLELSHTVRSDMFTILGVLQERGAPVCLKYMKNLLVNHLLEELGDLSAIAKSRLNKWHEHEMESEPSSWKQINNLIRMVDFPQLRSLSKNYREYAERLNRSKRKPSPLLLTTIKCEGKPLAIRYNSEGEIVIFDDRQNVVIYSIVSGKTTDTIPTGLESGLKGSIMGPNTFLGGLYVDESDNIFAYTFGTARRLTQNQGQSYNLPAVIDANLARVPFSGFERNNIVGITSLNGLYYILLYDRQNMQMISTDGKTSSRRSFRLHESSYTTYGTEDESPRMQSYGGGIILSAGRRLYVLNPELDLSRRIVFEGENSENPFVPTKFDFDENSNLWILNKLEGEEFPSVKAYSIHEQGDHFTARFETFIPLRKIDFAIGFRDVAIDRRRKFLGISNPFASEVDIYSLGGFLHN